MTLFSRLLNVDAGTPVEEVIPVEAAVTEADLRLPRAVLAPSVLTMAADGSVAPEEMAMLRNLCGFSPIYAPLPDTLVQQVIEEILTELKIAGADDVIAACAAVLTPEMRETAYCFAMRVAMVDGVLAHREKQALAEVANRFDMPDATVDKIIDVVAMLQRVG